MLTIATWLWGTKYNSSYVTKLYAGLKRNLNQPFRFICMTERSLCVEFCKGIERHAIKDPELLAIPGCLARLRMFDVGWQKNRGIDERLVCMDLDVVITGQLDHLFNRPEPFVILQGANSVNPCPYNGSIWMLRAGAHPEVWSDFSLDAVRKLPFHEFPDDQGWFWHKLPDVVGWRVGASSGIWAFRKRGWPIQNGDRLPDGARLVSN